MNEGATDDVHTQLAEVIVDVAREIQLRATQITPVVPLTPTQGQVMRYVHKNPGCSASDIADGARLQRANVSTALRELRARGYLTSLRDEHDGRAIRITATALADATIAKLTESWADLIRRAWEASPELQDPRIPETVLSALCAVRTELTADRDADRARTGYVPATSATAPPGEDSVPPG
ncbi:MarR family winged helix-turn-helix transcriptional regulator [Microbacterium sp. Marseille-Q6648]|uniref:MarR family winged helix-turn-helix transcriptional regulator n=1 Tax=Microbacterium sp. Marseille-Q6648 TaxID=2937991 RepID=UPI00203A4F4E|nr:MarR family winged helix-turn-helix transcriptional regulator [Microbacterium sp. Marseille-Q6648]